MLTALALACAATLCVAFTTRSLRRPPRPRRRNADALPRSGRKGGVALRSYNVFENRGPVGQKAALKIILIHDASRILTRTDLLYGRRPGEAATELADLVIGVGGHD